VAGLAQRVADLLLEGEPGMIGANRDFHGDKKMLAPAKSSGPPGAPERIHDLDAQHRAPVLQIFRVKPRCAAPRGRHKNQCVPERERIAVRQLGCQAHQL
jgi:hypothetical protein